MDEKIEAGHTELYNQRDSGLTLQQFGQPLKKRRLIACSGALET